MAALLLLGGCQGAALTTTTIPAALSGIQEDMAHAGAIPAARVTSWTTTQGAAFDQDVQAAQCLAMRPDPVVTVLSGDMNVTLTGSVTASGKITLASITSAPSLGAEADLAKTRAQTVLAPVTVTALSLLPDVEMSRRLAWEHDLLSGDGDKGGGSQAVQAQLDQERGDILADRNALRERVDGLIEDWTEAVCPFKSAAPFVGARP
ncbi:hypothetical protein GCM10007868_29970 [Gluconobacter frateurii]|nr:hypothetical protein GCM10007868_29970 [Gluconobacter frateurii]